MIILSSNSSMRYWRAQTLIETGVVVSLTLQLHLLVVGHSFSQILLQATCINELISMILLNIKRKLLHLLQICRQVGGSRNECLQLKQACSRIVVKMVEDVLGLSFAFVGEELQGLVSRNFYGFRILAALLISNDYKVIFVEFDTDQHICFIDFPYPRQLEIIFNVNLAPIKATSIRILPRNRPSPLSLRGVSQHKWKIGNIFNDFLLFFPVLLELASIITRFLLLQSLQQLEVLAIDGLNLFLAEWIIQAFVHPLILKILAMSLVDCMGNPLQEISIFSLNFGNFILHEAMLLFVIESGLTRRPFPSCCIGSYLPNPIQMLLEIALKLALQDDLLPPSQGSSHQLQQQLYVSLIITNPQPAQGCIQCTASMPQACRFDSPKPFLSFCPSCSCTSSRSAR